MSKARSLGIFATVAGAGAAVALARSRSLSERHFLKDIASRGMADVELGRIGALRAVHDDVREFSKRLAETHLNAIRHMQEIAVRKGVHLPEKVLAKHQWKIDLATRMDGAVFDRGYMRLVMREQQRDLLRFQRAADKATDRDVRLFATSTAEVLEHKLQEARAIYRRITEPLVIS